MADHDKVQDEAASVGVVVAWVCRLVDSSGSLPWALLTITSKAAAPQRLSITGCRTGSTPLF